MTADELVARYIMDKFRAEHSALIHGTHGTALERHLADCEDTKVIDPEAQDGSYGCETGCDYMTFEASLGCPHEDKQQSFQFGEFGRIYDTIEDFGKTLQAMEDATT